MTSDFFGIGVIMSQSILFRRILFSITLIFQLLTVLYSAESGLKTIETKVRGVTVVLAPKLKGRVCVMDLSESEDRTYTSEFGQIPQTFWGNELLNQKKWIMKSSHGRTRRNRVGILMVFGDDDATFKRLRKKRRWIQ